MTHIVREVEKPGSKLHKKETCEAVTIIEAPPMIVVGVVGYVKTPCGLRSLNSVWAQHLNEDVKRRFYKNWCKSKKKVFCKYSKKYESEEGIQSQLEKCSHTDSEDERAKAEEGSPDGDTSEGDVSKVDFANSFFEKQVPIDVVFQKDEMIGIIGVTKGKGYEGVVTRWGVTRLLRKTHSQIQLGFHLRSQGLVKMVIIIVQR